MGALTSRYWNMVKENSFTDNYDNKMVKNKRIATLIDPRSPICMGNNFDRTPIQIIQDATITSDLDDSLLCTNDTFIDKEKELVNKLQIQQSFSDPRSPTIGIERTPIEKINLQKKAILNQIEKLKITDLNEDTNDNKCENNFDKIEVIENEKNDTLSEINFDGSEISIIPVDKSLDEFTPKSIKPNLSSTPKLILNPCKKPLANVKPRTPLSSLKSKNEHNSINSIVNKNCKIANDKDLIITPVKGRLRLRYKQKSRRIQGKEN